MLVFLVQSRHIIDGVSLGRDYDSRAVALRATATQRIAEEATAQEEAAIAAAAVEASVGAVAQSAVDAQGQQS